MRCGEMKYDTIDCTDRNVLMLSKFTYSQYRYNFL